MKRNKSTLSGPLPSMKKGPMMHKIETKNHTKNNLKNEEMF